MIAIGSFGGRDREERFEGVDGRVGGEGPDFAVGDAGLHWAPDYSIDGSS